jgi:two-component system chemotaxis sensor kinase CheA
MVMLSLILCVAFTVLLVHNIRRNRNRLEQNRLQLTENIRRRGRLLVRNNRIALAGMIADNAFYSIQELVNETVQDTAHMDILRGICLNSNLRPMAYAVSGKKVRFGGAHLEDDITRWFEEQGRSITDTQYVGAEELGGAEVFEFSAPIIGDYSDEIIGYIRYTISAKSLHDEILRVEQEAQRELAFIILFFFLLLAVSIGMAYFVLSSLAKNITYPIINLADSAQELSNGNYDARIEFLTDDEVGVLSHAFDNMRCEIKKYTEGLQGVIDEKMHQVKEILNTIEQGLITIDFEGRIGDEYSARANEIFGVADVSRNNIFELLRLDTDDARSFATWLELVRIRAGSQRWNKLEKLAPLHELILTQDDGIRYISLQYQKIEGSDSAVSGIMVLARDVTESRKKEMQLQEERHRHEEEKEIIFGIINSSAENIEDFITDTDSRMELIVKSIRDIRKRVYRDHSTDIKDRQRQILSRHLHTIKGNASSYGFENLARAAHAAESAVKECGQLNAESHAVFAAIEDISCAYGKISNMIGRISSALTSQKRIVQAGEAEYLHTLVDSLHCDETDTLNRLRAGIRSLRWQTLSVLGRKYRCEVLNIARHLDKDIEFVYSDANRLLAPDFFKDIDEALIHLVRNAAVHGIESGEIRKKAGKKRGRIQLSAEYEDEMRIVRISDDGAGIRTDTIRTRAIEQKLITAGRADMLSEQDVYSLLFHPGFSTAHRLTDYAGRGIGLDAVKQNIESAGGEISIESVPGHGTTFILVLKR